GTSVGITRVGDLTFHTTGVLGLSRHEGKLDVRAFPDWITLPGPQWLAMGRNWHFTAAWIFAPLLLVYVAYTLISPRRRRLIFPTRRQWRELPRTIIEHARLRFEHRADYNGLQKLTYLAIIFIVLPLMVLTGLTMSPTMDSAWPWLLSVFGGRQSARTIHFIGAFTLVAFFLVHLAMVLISGFFNNMRSITSGGYRIHELSDREDKTP
ncbi:MAG: cytochrome b/b6 domain-containing protein, partial [Ectothiorhodospiraceae bacterium]